MNFTKMHGAGNDYVFVNGFAESGNWPEISRQISDRHFGVGSDGLILATDSDIADIRMRMWNSDGSESEMCGNGLRCFVKFVLDHKILDGNPSLIRIETGAGILETKPIWNNGLVTTAIVDMGPPELRIQQIPVAIENASPSELSNLNTTIGESFNIDAGNILFDSTIDLPGRSFVVTGVSMGNPHAVAFIDDDVADVDLEYYGPLMENHPVFPNRVNFHIANIIDSTRIVTRTWERGAGQTLACGTGACAMLVSGRLHGLLDEKVTIEVPGGELLATWTGDGSVKLEGPVQKVFEGLWEGN